MAYAQLLQEIKYIDGGQGGKLRVVLVDHEWRVQRSIPKNTFAGEGDYSFVTLLRAVTEANILYSCSLQLHGGGHSSPVSSYILNVCTIYTYFHGAFYV